MAASRSRSRPSVRGTKTSNSASRKLRSRKSSASTSKPQSPRGHTSKVSKQGSSKLQKHQRQNASPHAASSQQATGKRQVATSTPEINNNSTKAAAKSKGKPDSSRNSPHQNVNSSFRPNTRSSCRSQTVVTSRPSTRSGCRSETTCSSPYGRNSRNSTKPRRQVDTREPRPSTSDGTRRQVGSPKSAPRCQSGLSDTKGGGRKPTKRRKGKGGRLAPYRTRSPVRQMTKAEKERNVQELIYRIESLPLYDRPIPNTTDTTVLGFELKVRLGARAPSLVETGHRGRQVRVTESNEKSRLIPVLDISPDQDPNVHCSVRVKKVSQTRRRGRGAR